jgi:hypothetical protein
VLLQWIDQVNAYLKLLQGLVGNINIATELSVGCGVRAFFRIFTTGLAQKPKN